MKLSKLMYIACFALTASPVFAAELTVNCNADYPTIQAAVNAANPYDTITVCPGTYNESVLIQTEGLTIRSTEISDRGPNTIVRRFAIGFAPNSGPHSVTIKGFSVTGSNVCIESSGDYNTIAFNNVNSCNLGIRVNAGNVGNNVHHNHVMNTSSGGITIEGYGGCCGSAGPGMNHNVHQNMVYNAGGEGCFYIWASNTEVHQNQASGTCGNGGINAIGSSGLHIHHNEICADIALFNATNADVHHNELTGRITNENSDDNLKKNKEELSTCPVPAPTPG